MMTLYLMATTGLLANRTNLMICLIAFELMLLAGVLNGLFLSTITNELFGSFLAIITMIMTGAESAIGLSLIVVFFRSNETLQLD